MNTALYDTLLQLFQQVTHDPDSMPTVPVNEWQEESVEWQLLTGFHDMLERVQQRMQEALRIEEQLREKEAEYRSIFEAAIDALFIANLDGFIVEANPAACRTYGYTYEEFIGLHGTAITAPDSQHLVTEALQTIKAGEKYEVPVRAAGLRKDGSTFMTDGYSTPFMYKGNLHILAVVRDVTEQVQAEEQLREKEAQYRSIFEATTDGIIIADLDGYPVEVNPAACKMHGYSYEEFIGLQPATFIHSDFYHLVTGHIQSIRAGKQLQSRGALLRKDGSPFLIEAHTTPFIYKGKPHILSVNRDITEQVRAEQELREKETQYRSIFEASTDGLIIADLDGYIVEANPATCKMFGYTYEEFVGLPATAITHPDRHHEIVESIQTIHTGHQQYYAQTIGLHKDGTQFYTEARTTPFIYKGQPHLLGVVRDISERVRAEHQLREREEQYRSIFEATSDGLLIVDLDGVIVEVNPAACKMYNYSYEEFLGLHINDLTLPEYYPLVTQALQTVQAGKQLQMQGDVPRKDGTTFYAETRASTFTFQGKPHGLAVVRDVTEQVQAQQLLEQRVEERTRELSTLLEVSHNVASTIELKPLMGLILDQLKSAVDYTGSAILTVEGDDLVIVDNRGPTSVEQALHLRFSLRQMGSIWQMIACQELIFIDDVRSDTPVAQAFQEWLGEHLQTTLGYIRAWMGIPLVLKEQVIGMLSLSHRESNYYTPRHATLALAIANQAAVAIENARLYEQAQTLAALEERQRLARELHDSVSQALYGISLGAHTARTLLDRDPGKVAEPLNYVLSQAEAALTEMRALIFELRPETLETDGLVVALGRQVAALHARHDIEVSTELGDEPDLSLKVKQELYRIAQEALHNTVKHARATKVDMRMHWSPESFLLEIRDDGIGFDPASAFPGHLGLHSMRERVTRLGGVLQIESAPGQGTCIRVRLPVQT